MKATGEMPAICGAKNRRGEPCRKFPVKGKKRCRNHGGKSTGPKTAEGKAKAVEAVTDHGAYANLGVYERLLAAARPELWAEIPNDTSLERELRFARLRLANLPADAGETARSALLGEIRLLASAQHEIRPGTNASGKFEITFKIEEPAPPTAEPAEPKPEAEGPCS